LIPSNWFNRNNASNAALDWCNGVQRALARRQAQLLLVLGGTATAAVPGISAAGATPSSRRFTAAADAELLLLGPGSTLPHQLPPLPAGVSPALISWAAQQQLALPSLVVDAGCAVAPAVPHLRLGLPPALCLSSGAAMLPAEVERRRQLGRQLGRSWCWQYPEGLLVLAECVPGGTSTAEAMLTGLGLAVSGLLSGSLQQPPHALRASLVQQGLAAAADRGTQSNDPVALLAAVGDPLQAFALGLIEGMFASAAHGAGPQLLLAGGSQMLAIAALALAVLPEGLRSLLSSRVAVVTTAWVAAEPGSNLELLAGAIANVWGVAPLGFHSSLRFHSCRNQLLRDYERGFVKEGVGAGGMAWLWELAGHDPEALAAACDRACDLLLAR
jgi:uncharacterized protein (TIGR00303 family)